MKRWLQGLWFPGALAFLRPGLKRRLCHVLISAPEKWLNLSEPGSSRAQLSCTAFYVPGAGLSPVHGVHYLTPRATTQGSCGGMGRRTSEPQATELELGVPEIKKPGLPISLGLQRPLLSQMYIPFRHPSPLAHTGCLNALPCVAHLPSPLPTSGCFLYALPQPENLPTMALCCFPDSFCSLQLRVAV